MYTICLVFGVFVLFYFNVDKQYSQKITSGKILLIVVTRSGIEGFSFVTSYLSVLLGFVIICIITFEINFYKTRIKILGLLKRLKIQVCGKMNLCK